MADKMSSRQRMLAAFDCQRPDHVPCSFMIFAALREQCADPFEFVERQVDMGLDATVAIPVRPTRRRRDEIENGDLHGLPVRFGPAVRVKDWREDAPGQRYSILHRQYDTPAGSLHTAVRKTEDWVQGDRVPLFDDYVIPRAVERLIKGPADLEALHYLLRPPTDAEIAAFRQAARPAKELAAKHGLCVVAEWGVLFDAACWLCGMEEIAVAAIEAPDFLDGVLGLIAEWNRRRMEVVLQEGVDLFIRRAWYETTDFMSPQTYRRFILPHLREDARLAHQAGAKLAIITTSCYQQLLDLYLEAGIDVLIGLDPIQDPQADFKRTRQKTAGRICLWGGVSGDLTVEPAGEREVRQAVRSAMWELGRDGGFILSPVDNVRTNCRKTWRNVRAFIDEWRRGRDDPPTA